MPRPINYILIEKVRYYASVGLLLDQMSYTLDKSESAICAIIQKYKIKINREPQEICSINDKELDRRCHEYALSLGIDNSCKTRKATAQELAELKNVKPFDKKNNEQTMSYTTDAIKRHKNNPMGICAGITNRKESERKREAYNRTLDRHCSADLWQM